MLHPKSTLQRIILKEIKLFEYSLVPFPMNPEAQITGVKGLDEFEARLRELIAYSKENKGQALGKNGGLLEQAIEHLQMLRSGGRSFDEVQAAKTCDVLLSNLERHNAPSKFRGSHNY